MFKWNTKDAGRPQREPSARGTVSAISVELLGGVIAGLLLAGLGGLLGAQLGRASSSGWGDLIGAVLGAWLGCLIGVAAGMSIAGRLLAQRGSPWLALLGSFIGGTLALLLAEPLRLNQHPALLASAVLIAALTLAAFGFNGWRMRQY
jgi:hypothetical protein